MTLIYRSPESNLDLFFLVFINIPFKIFNSLTYFFVVFEVI